MAALMLPGAVLTHLKADVFAALGPEPVLMVAWLHPARVTAAKQARPQLDNGAGGIEALAWPKTAIRPVTRYSFS